MKTKYPRTPHLPFSLGRSADDKILQSMSHFEGRDIVVTLKMDGENTSLYADGYHARSLDSRHHPSRDWLKAYHANHLAQVIPAGWRVCGENLFARHSIGYTDLQSYFMGFSIWNAENRALSWAETLVYFELMGITPVTEVYRGVFDEAVLRKLADTLDTEKNEGFVVRLASEFAYNDFRVSVAKWVRPKHVQTSEHWMHAAVVPNELKAQHA